MATVSAARAASTQPVAGGSGASIKTAWGVYELASNLAATTIIEFCRVPAGAVVLGGWVQGDDLDAAATAELDFDVGYAANGDVNGDPDAFGNFGTVTGAAVTGWKPEAGILFPLNGTLKDGPVTFNRETTIQAVINTDSATTGTGTLWCRVNYIVP